MKRQLKIRFVRYKCESNADYYLIQKKGLFGWKFITYSYNMYGGTCISYYEGIDKEILLEEVLDKEYKTCKKFVSIIEYPELISY